MVMQEIGLEFTSYALKLVKEKIFDKALKAINNEDLEKFREVCIEAGIPKDVTGVSSDMHSVLYAMLRAGLGEYPDMMAWP